MPVRAAPDFSAFANAHSAFYSSARLRAGSQLLPFSQSLRLASELHEAPGPDAKSPGTGRKKTGGVVASRS